MKKYLIQVASSGQDCFIAECDGDPGRTLIKSSAKVFANKRKADFLKQRLKAKYPNRELKVVEFDHDKKVMNKKESIKVLSDHQRWRKGDDEIKATEPKELSNALDLAIECLKSSSWRKVSEELPNDNIDVLVKIDIQGYIHYDVDRIIYGEWCNGDDGIVEWKPIY